MSRLVHRVFEVETRLQHYRRFPLERIQAVTGTPRLCTVAFNYTDFYTYAKLAAAGIRLRDIKYREDVEFALLVSVHANPFEGSTTVSFKYKPEALGDEAVQRYVGYFADVVRRALEDPEQPVLRALTAGLHTRHESAAVTLGRSREQGPGTPARRPTPQPPRAEPAAATAPSSLEREVLAVWSQVLGHEVTDAAYWKDTTGAPCPRSWWWAPTIGPPRRGPHGRRVDPGCAPASHANCGHTSTLEQPPVITDLPCGRSSPTRRPDQPR